MTLKAARAELADLIGQALGAGATVYDTVPERVNAPAAIIRPADEYVAVPETFGRDRVISLDVVLVAKSGRNNLTSDDLDSMIDAVLDQLAGTDWDAPAVPAPFVAGFAGTNYLCCGLTTAAVYNTN